jgi:hypothetical protein
LARAPRRLNNGPAMQKSMILYKYAGDSGIHILDGLRLKVTPPNELNDPFELTPRSKNLITRKYIVEKAKNDPEHFRAMYEEIVRRENYKWPFEVFLQTLKLPRDVYSRFRKLYADGLVETDLGSIQEASRSMVILCLSAMNDSIPMWSHYSNHHRGIVIGLDTSDSCFQHGSAMSKVIYRAHRVSVNPLDDANPGAVWAKALETILTKSRVWEYEKEYRACYRIRDVISKPLGGNQPHYFIDIWASVIKEVILGCWISEEYEARVRSVLSAKKFSHVRILRASRHKSKFKIEVVSA